MRVDMYEKKESCGEEFLVVDPKTYPYGDYEFEDENNIKERYWADILPGERVLDIGASWGGYTLPALAQGARVIAVEPSVKGRATLTDSVEANGWSDRAVILGAVLWNIEPMDPVFKRDILERNFGADSLLVQSPATLDDLIPDVVRIDRIKMDVEGAELAILEGSVETLRRCLPKLILIEDHTAETEEHARWMPMLVGMRDRVTMFLHGYGYRVELERQPTGNPFLIARRD
jgi:FkbM family methyltransferase